LPHSQTEKSPDSYPSEPSRIGPLRALQTPIEVLLGAGRVQFSIKLAIVSFLVDNQTFSSRGNQGLIIRGFQRSDLERDRRDEADESLNDRTQIVIRDKFWMLAGNQQNTAKPFSCQVPRFTLYFFRREGNAQNGIVAREAAVLATVNTLVGQI
jgi:hypothetical protein